MTSIERFPNLMSFFHEELQSAFKELRMETSEETEAYLVHLLDGFAKPSAAANADLGFETPAAILLDEAISAPDDRKIDIYRRLGDSSLYSCGFLPEYLSKKTVGMQYYKNMGTIAYQALSDLMRFKAPGGVFDLIYKELSQKFNECVNAFRLVGSRPRGIQLLSFGHTPSLSGRD